MSQIVRKKKGRPSKADLAARAAAAESNNGHSNHNRRATAAEEEEERDIRRSLRRRSGVRYNLLDYDEDYLDDDDEFEFDEDKMEAEDDDGGGGRREKKLKFVLKLRNSSDSGRAARSNGGGSSDSVVRAQRAGCTGSESEDEEEEEGEEERFVKKRKISDDEDEVDDDFGNNDDEEERGGKREYHKHDFVNGSMNDVQSRTPLPEKKQLELILDKLQKKDTYGVYAEPVDPDELPDYHDIIKNPMDFSTVRKKLANGSYSIFEQFERDVYLICSNAMKYNTSDTVYHKQARTIKELAQKKFHRVRLYIKQTRIENEEIKKEADSEQKAKPSPIVKKQMRNPLGHSTQDPVSSDFSYGATLATADVHNRSNGVQASTYERHSDCEGLVEDMSSLRVENVEKVEDIQSGKGMTKFGRKPLVVDENHRATYEISNQPVDRSESIFATFEGEDKQLIPVGLYEEHSYAQSLSHFAATLGPVAWRTASKRIEQALPQGSKFGRGWVVEYEPIPTPVLYVADQSPKEYTSAKKPHCPAAPVKLRKPSETPNSSSEQLCVVGPSSNGKPCFFPGSGGGRPTTPSGSIVQQQNPFVRKLQNAANLSEKPSPPDDRGQKRCKQTNYRADIQYMQNCCNIPGYAIGMRPQSACVPAKINKSSESVVTTSGCIESGSISEGKSSIFPTSRGSRPTTPTGPVIQPQNPFSRTSARPENSSSNRMDTNAPTLTNQKTSTFVQKQFSGSAEIPTSWLEDSTARNKNFLQQPVPLRPIFPASEGVVPGRFPNGNVNRCVDINQMATTSPSSGAPTQVSGAKMSFPPRQEQGLSDPLQAMRLSVENAQKQHNQMNNLLGPLQVRPPVQSLRGDNNMSGAAPASVAWMHASPVTGNLSAHGNQIPAGPVYNRTQELYPHIIQSSECPVSGSRYFPPERSKASFEEHVSNHAKASNEAHVQNRSSVFPQFLGNDVSRIQLQSPRHGLSPRTEQKKKRDMLPPDLNVAFQSTVDPQQPDLALQL